MDNIIQTIKIVLCNLSLYWDIEKQYYHKNDRLRSKNKSLYISRNSKLDKL